MTVSKILKAFAIVVVMSLIAEEKKFSRLEKFCGKNIVHFVFNIKLQNSRR